MYSYLDVAFEAGVERVTLNRPEVRNAFNDGLIEELDRWARSVERRPEVRVAVLGGAGKAFSAGADLAWMAEAAARSRDRNVADATRMAAMFRALDELGVPLVGRVHGAALGGGAGLVAVCDVVVADDQAVFGFTETRLGLVPAVIAPFVLAKIGRSAAREYFLTGARFTAARAREIGLVHAVANGDDLDGTVDGFVRDLMLGGPESVRAAKALIRDAWGRSPEQSAALTADLIADRRASAEGQEGMQAFLEKRAPGWVK